MQNNHITEMYAIREAQSKQEAYNKANPDRVIVSKSCIVRRDGRKLTLNLNMNIEGKVSNPLQFKSMEFWISEKCAIETEHGISIPEWLIKKPLKQQALNHLWVYLPTVENGRDSYRTFLINPL